MNKQEGGVSTGTDSDGASGLCTLKHVAEERRIKSAELAATQGKLRKNVHCYPPGCLLWSFP